MKILVVEDEGGIRSLLTQLLAMRGHAVHEASNGEDAWDTYAKAPDEIDLVLSDLKMPQLDGLGLLKRIRDGKAEVPFLLMTGHADLSEEERAGLGAAEVLAKPFAVKDLLASVSRLEHRH